MYLQLMFAQYRLCVPPRFTLMEALVVRMWFFPQVLLCGLSTSVFKEKPINSDADRQMSRTAILMSQVRGTTPATEVPSLRKALA